MTILPSDVPVIVPGFGGLAYNSPRGGGCGLCAKLQATCILCRFNNAVNEHKDINELEKKQYEGKAKPETRKIKQPKKPRLSPPSPLQAGCTAPAPVPTRVKGGSSPNDDFIFPGFLGRTLYKQFESARQPSTDSQCMSGSVLPGFLQRMENKQPQSSRRRPFVPYPSPPPSPPPAGGQGNGHRWLEITRLTAGST